MGKMAVLRGGASKGRLSNGSEPQKLHEMSKIYIDSMANHQRKMVHISDQDFGALLQLTLACKRFALSSGCPNYLIDALEHSLKFRSEGWE